MLDLLCGCIYVFKYVGVFDILVDFLGCFCICGIGLLKGGGWGVDERCIEGEVEMVKFSDWDEMWLGLGVWERWCGGDEDWNIWLMNELVEKEEKDEWIV